MLGRPRRPTYRKYASRRGLSRASSGSQLGPLTGVPICSSSFVARSPATVNVQEVRLPSRASSRLVWLATWPAHWRSNLLLILRCSVARDGQRTGSTPPVAGFLAPRLARNLARSLAFQFAPHPSLLGRPRRSTYRKYASRRGLPRASSGSQLGPLTGVPICSSSFVARSPATVDVQEIRLPSRASSRLVWLATWPAHWRSNLLLILRCSVARDGRRTGNTPPVAGFLAPRLARNLARSLAFQFAPHPSLLGRPRRSTYRKYASRRGLPRASSGSQLGPLTGVPICSSSFVA